MNKKSIEKYRAEVDARPYESHNQYRNKVGRQKRWAYLLANRPHHWIRREDKRRYAEAVIRVEERVAEEVKALRIVQEDNFRLQQMLHDEPKYAQQSGMSLEEYRKFKMEKAMIGMGEEE